MGLYYAMREVMPIMQLMKDLKRGGFIIESTITELACKFFKKNSGAL